MMVVSRGKQQPHFRPTADFQRQTPRRPLHGSAETEAGHRVAAADLARMAEMIETAGADWTDSAEWSLSQDSAAQSLNDLAAVERI